MLGPNVQHGCLRMEKEGRGERVALQRPCSQAEGLHLTTVMGTMDCNRACPLGGLTSMLGSGL